MKIVIVNHGLFPEQLGGMEKHTTFLANHLQKLGARVAVVVPEFVNPEDTTAHTHADYDRHFKLKRFAWPQKRPWLKANYEFSKNVAEYLAQETIDILYCQGFSGWAYLTKQPIAQRAASFYNPHGMEMFKHNKLKQRLKHLPLQYAARVQAKHADRVVSLGGKLTHQIKRYLKVPDERIVTLPNGIDLTYVDAMIDKSNTKLREKGKLSQFLFVGRLEQNKGIRYLCEAFKNIRGARLIIVGGGSLEEELRVHYAGRNIYFSGAIDEDRLFALYQQSDCFIFPSLFEGMPTVILEAMANSLPVIATDIGAVTTMVDTENGIVVPPADSKSLKAAVNTFLDYSNERVKQMGRISRVRVADLFTWDRIASDTLRACHDLVESRKNASPIRAC